MTKDERIAAMRKRRDRAIRMCRASFKAYKRRARYRAQVAYYEAVLVELENL